MSKNIVICCDGTGNQFGETPSNVVKLYSMLQKNSQACYYDPGVGTMPDARLVTSWTRKISQAFGLAFGTGLIQNVKEAYSFIMENYEQGDKLFLFGFSRGAYTARVIAALIFKIGVLPKGNQNLIDYAFDIYRLSYQPTYETIAAKFKTTYALDIKINFLGIWDTVTSMGLFNSKFLPDTTTNHYCLVVRHAMAIDERRAYYRQNLLQSDPSIQDVRQVWFAGVHCDIGGSYPEAESGLSQIALEWIIAESIKHGLSVNATRLVEILYGSNGSQARQPDPTEPVHKSLSGLWWLLEYLPRRNKANGKYFIPNARPRRIRYKEMTYTPIIHQSVLDKIAAGQYNPVNLEMPYDVEPYLSPTVHS